LYKVKRRKRIYIYIYCVKLLNGGCTTTQYIVSSSSNRIFICVENLGDEKRKKTAERKSVEIPRNRGLVFFPLEIFLLANNPFRLGRTALFRRLLLLRRRSPVGMENVEKSRLFLFPFFSFFSSRYMYMCVYIYNMNPRSAERCNKRVNSFKGVTIKWGGRAVQPMR